MIRYDGVRVSTLTTTYDAGGQVQSTQLTTYYFGGAYEVRDSQVIKYYSFAGQTIAMNDGAGLQYFLTDHLGSIVAVTDSSGTLTSEQRYLPFGQVREDAGVIAQTDFGYTGQRDLGGDLGLMDYRARFYDPYLSRFTQPDTLIPNPSNPQAFNRYSYVLNRPIVYIDPTGHIGGPITLCEITGGCPPPDPCDLYSDSPQCWIKDNKGDSERASAKIPKPVFGGISAQVGSTGQYDDWKTDAAEAASRAALVYDTAAAYISTANAVIVDVIGGVLIGGGCATGTLVGPTGTVVGCGESITWAWAIDFGMTQFTPWGQAENALGILSFASTAAADVFAGNTGISASGHIQIGKDTLVSYRNAIVGFTPEANIDMLVSLSQYNYDRQRLAGVKPGGTIEVANLGDIIDVFLQVILQDWR